MPFEPIVLPAIDPSLAIWLKGIFLGAVLGVGLSFVILEIQTRRMK